MYAVNQKMVRRVIAEENLNATEVAKMLNISPKAACNKLNDPDGRLWWGHELATLASNVRVDPGSFFSVFECT